MASTPNTAATLLVQLRAIHELTNTEIQIAETRIAQARKNRHGVVSAAQSRLAAIAQEVAGIT